MFNKHLFSEDSRREMNQINSGDNGNTRETLPSWVTAVLTRSEAEIVVPRNTDIRKRRD